MASDAIVPHDCFARGRRLYLADKRPRLEHVGTAMEAKPRITRRRWLHQAGAAALAAVASRGLGVTAMAANPTGLRIIDPHVHVWKNDARYPWPADLAKPPAEDALPETLLELMRAHGVERTVVVHVIYYRWDCRYAADVVRAHPDRFMGVCRIDPQSPRAVAELDRWTAEGFHGVRLSPGSGAGGDWIRDVPRMDAIWSRAAELKIPMCVLCPIDRIPDVERAIERHQGRLDVCIDHMADCPIDRPNELKKLLALARYERVYVKLSHLWSLSREAYPYRDTHDQVRRLYDAFGPERLMWGTDWPGVDAFCGYGRALALYRDEIKFFNDDDRKWILGQTALKLWPFASAT
jgi:L-fuconolactonase